MVVLLEVVVVWLAFSTVAAVVVGTFIARASEVSAEHVLDHAAQRQRAASALPTPRAPLDVLQLRLAGGESRASTSE